MIGMLSLINHAIPWLVMMAMLLLVSHGGQAIFWEPLIFCFGHDAWVATKRTKSEAGQQALSVQTCVLKFLFKQTLIYLLRCDSQVLLQIHRNTTSALPWQRPKSDRLKSKRYFKGFPAHDELNTCQTSLVSPEQPDLCILDRLCLSVSMACSLSLATSVLCPYVGNVEKIQRKRGVLQTDSSFVHFHGHASTYVQAVLRTQHRH